MATVTVWIPSPLRDLTDGAASLEVPGTTVAELLEAAGERHPALLPRLLGPDGQPHPYVNLFLDERDIRALDGLQTPVETGQQLLVLPAVAGGAEASRGSGVPSRPSKLDL